MWWNGPHAGMNWAWWMPLHGLLSLLFLAFVIVCVVVLVRGVSGAGARGFEDTEALRPLDVLKERYAKGEIERDEYLQKLGDLGG